jgi:hypothetical protein
MPVQIQVRHKWNLTPGEARDLQLKLSERVERKGRRPRIRTAADAGRRSLRSGRETREIERLAEGSPAGQCHFPYRNFGCNSDTSFAILRWQYFTSRIIGLSERAGRTGPVE